QEAGRPLSASPARRKAARRRLEADLRRYLADAAEQESPHEPARLELGFGFEEGDPGADEGAVGAAELEELPAYALGDGARLRGRVDRVDLTAGGDAVVY